MSSDEIHYKVAWRATSNFPGHHQSLQKGGGLQFRNHVPLADAPDPRRFDIRASLRDPFEQIQVRVYQQPSAIPVFVIADLSASMGFVGAHAKVDVVADFVANLSYSAYRTGDRFGFVGCAERTIDEFVLPPTMNRASGMALAERLRAMRPRGRNSLGLLEAADLLGPRRALVFLLSDFHISETLLERLFNTLAYHDVVPVLLWDRREFADLPRFGLARVVDDETGHSRLLFMRPSLRRQIEQAFAERRARLDELCLRHGRPPLVVDLGFDADEVTHYFFG